MAEKIIRNKKFIFTDHSLKRFSARRINDELFNLVVIHGRKFYSNGAEIYFVGKKEVKKARKLGIDLRSAEGLNIIVQPYGDEKIVITGFKNPSLKKYRQN